MIYTTGALREQFGMDLMQRIEGVINNNKHREKPYFLLVSTTKLGSMFSTKIIIMDKSQFVRDERGRVIPLLGTVLFGVDNNTGKLNLVWALPHDIPQTQDIYGDVIQGVAEQAWNLNMPIINS